VTISTGSGQDGGFIISDLSSSHSDVFLSVIGELTVVVSQALESVT